MDSFFIVATIFLQCYSSFLRKSITRTVKIKPQKKKMMTSPSSDISSGKREVTLDCISLHTTKGHFCSLLISNIFCYPLFLRLPVAASLQFVKHIALNFSLRRILTVLNCTCLRKRRGFNFFMKALFCFILTDLFLTLTQIYIKRNTVVYFLFPRTTCQLKFISFHILFSFSAPILKL